VCVYILFVLSCVQVQALRRADPHPSGLTDCVQDKETPKPNKFLYDVRSSGQSSWPQIKRYRVRFPALPERSSGTGMGSTQPREYN
jgi:hypothetical protein